MKGATEPEVRRIPLEEVCLSILASGFSVNCSDFLRQTPQSPPDEAVNSAMHILVEIGAVVTEENCHRLTSLGRNLARLPVRPK